MQTSRVSLMCVIPTGILLAKLAAQILASLIGRKQTSRLTTLSQRQGVHSAIVGDAVAVEKQGMSVVS
jgi:hypothetical protein